MGLGPEGLPRDARTRGGVGCLGGLLQRLRPPVARRALDGEGEERIDAASTLEVREDGALPSVHERDRAGSLPMAAAGGGRPHSRGIERRDDGREAPVYQPDPLTLGRMSFRENDLDRVTPVAHQSFPFRFESLTMARTRT